MDGMLTILDNPNYKNEDNNDNLSTITELTVKPLKSLEIKANFTYALNQYRNMNRATNTEYSRYPGETVQVTNSRSVDNLYEKFGPSTIMPRMSMRLGQKVSHRLIISRSWPVSTGRPNITKMSPQKATT